MELVLATGNKGKLREFQQMFAPDGFNILGLDTVRGCPEIIEDGDDFVLKLPMPHVELDKVNLTKRGDELFIRIGNFKRELLLPVALAHREASGAVFSNGTLHVRFPPPQEAPVG